MAMQHLVQASNTFAKTVRDVASLRNDVPMDELETFDRLMQKVLVYRLEHMFHMFKPKK